MCGQRESIWKLIAAAPCIQDPNLSYGEKTTEKHQMASAPFFSPVIYSTEIPLQFFDSTVQWIGSGPRRFFAIFQLNHQMCVCTNCLKCGINTAFGVDFFIYLRKKKNMKFQQKATYSFVKCGRSKCIHKTRRYLSVPPKTKHPWNNRLLAQAYAQGMDSLTSKSIPW